MSVISRQTENHAVPAAARDSWRNWLMTGSRQEPIYRRRVRGAHKGLKRMLVEGTADGDDNGHAWKRFSGAMVRQAVDEAVSSLPPRQNQLLKLAYFSGLTNREIAHALGITLSSVERGLREAIARVSEFIERGKGVGRKVVYAIGLFFAGRQLVKTGVLIVATATAGAVVSAQPASPVHLAPVDPARVPAVTAAQPYVVLQHRVVNVARATSTAAAHVVSLPPKLDLPKVTVPIPLTLPPVQVPPIHHGVLGA
jgi:DNA-binding CsgD family transcriptional regulator